MRIGFATTPEPPYLAVIFTSRRSPDDEGYAAMSAEMEALAAKQPGYLGIESARGADGMGITVSYWRDENRTAHGRPSAALAQHRRPAARSGMALSKCALRAWSVPTADPEECALYSRSIS